MSSTPPSPDSTSDLKRGFPPSPGFPIGERRSERFGKRRALLDIRLDEDQDVFDFLRAHVLVGAAIGNPTERVERLPQPIPIQHLVALQVKFQEIALTEAVVPLSGWNYFTFFITRSRVRTGESNQSASAASRMRQARSGSGSPRPPRTMIEAETRLYPRGQMSGIGSPRIRQLLHFRGIAVKRLVFGKIVERPTRGIVDEGFRRSIVGQDDLVHLGLDVIDRVAVAELGKRNPGYRRSVDQGSSLAQNAVDEHRVIGSDG